MADKVESVYRQRFSLWPLHSASWKIASSLRGDGTNITGTSSPSRLAILHARPVMVLCSCVATVGDTGCDVLYCAALSVRETMEEAQSRFAKNKYAVS
jgi:hypothetical protein